MCGIVGLIQFGEHHGNGAGRGSDVLTHRGPDDSGAWRSRAYGARVALGHRRLSILDLSSAGAQPMLQREDMSFAPARNGDETARLALVYNGEIYNFVELRDELRKEGHRFESGGDTEVLLAAYAQWGEQCLQRLNGMFAFAVWDHRRQRLFCARDRFGEKPFYFTLDSRGERFAFASEVKGLVAMGVVSPEPSTRALYRFFRFGEQAGVEETVWRDVRKLLPGTSLTVQLSGTRLTTRVQKYWDIGIAEGEPLAPRQAADRFAELFRDSVRLRLRADVPIGTSLSGGLDSSSVLCQIHALGAAAGQKAFTARMDDPRLDEGKYVDLVLAQTGVPGFSVTPTAREFMASLDVLSYHQEEPFTSTSVFASYLVQGLAKRTGVTVMLDGQGADEYLAGYAHYPALLLSSLAGGGRWGKWWRERIRTRNRLGIDPVPPRAALHYWLASARREGQSTQLLIDAPREAAFLTADLREEHAGEEPRTLAVEGDLLKSRLYADLMHGHLQELLRYADRNSMAFSMEVRLPFLDHRLVEFAMSLPSDLLFHEGRSKRVLRDAMRGVVPEAILERRDKVGFMAPWAQWCADPEVVAWLKARLDDTRTLMEDYVDIDAVPFGSPAVLGVLTFASSLNQLRSIERDSAPMMCLPG